mmetsp:Transcript_14585/g.41440  ORF Transcript_14585/g.41440 Transcript_14585/m.41440 type:complete len:728 (+) Transcript_14585:232-2415(+)|eukprot:CAMPEP_0119130124 /NCGR_PEP_ID=MMETSP1310-20130426/7585_1 /TAXON_ID=464262 /ORGANISM="Genus nov. species nov., Strain RCC2339" /LENGTH=727 /DNA_ID=CAMNT_0007120601 /DNA_START=142 /DNA_END=2325 /DNA_ORIENTATION=-
MASKTAVAIVVDVGATMCEGDKSAVEGALRAVEGMVKSHILYSKQTTITMLLVGTKETRHHLGVGMGYEHVYELCDLEKPSLKCITGLRDLEAGSKRADVLDGLIVALDTMVSKTTPKNQRRVLLLSDFRSELNQDDLHTVVDQLEKWSVSMDVVGVDLFESRDLADGANLTGGKDPCRDSNVAMLRTIASRIPVRVQSLRQALRSFQQPRAKTVRQVTTFRGALEITPDLRIPVWAYLQVSEKKMETPKKVSTVAPGADGALPAVRLERSYVCLANPDEELEADLLVKGYKYGKTFVPFSKADEAALKYAAPKCLKLIGFTRRSYIPRHHFMGGPEVLTPQPGYPEAGAAVASLATALYETDRAAIVRFVKREGQAPKLGALLPYIKPGHHTLHFVSLPFSDDLREYPFDSLELGALRKRHRPNEHQLQAAEDLIHALDLMRDRQEGDAEPIGSKQTFNPALHHLYETLHQRALNPGCPIPPLDPALAAPLRPAPATFERAAPELERFHDAFPTEFVARRAAGQKRIFRPDDGETVTLANYTASKKRRTGEPDEKVKEEKLTLTGLVESKVTSVGGVNPVGDFRAMIESQNEDLVLKAVEQLAEHVARDVQASIEDELFGKSLLCLRALREGCVTLGEAPRFNAFLKQLRDSTKGKKKNGFWNMLVVERVTLISLRESKSSVVTPDEAEQFLAGDALPSSPKVESDATPMVQDDGDEDADDLLGGL